MNTEQLRKEWVMIYRSEKGSERELRAYRDYVLASQGVKPEDKQQNLFGGKTK